MGLVGAIASTPLNDSFLLVMSVETGGAIARWIGANVGGQTSDMMASIRRALQKYPPHPPQRPLRADKNHIWDRGQPSTNNIPIGLAPVRRLTRFRVESHINHLLILRRKSSNILNVIET